MIEKKKSTENNQRWEERGEEEGRARQGEARQGKGKGSEGDQG
jgi:hypothetical protein